MTDVRWVVEHCKNATVGGEGWGQVNGEQRQIRTLEILARAPWARRVQVRVEVLPR